MSEQPPQDEKPKAGTKQPAQEPKKQSREERLAEALRANLRRRKSASKARKDV